MSSSSLPTSFPSLPHSQPFQSSQSSAPSSQQPPSNRSIPRPAPSQTPRKRKMSISLSDSSDEDPSQRDLEDGADGDEEIRDDAVCGSQEVRGGDDFALDPGEEPDEDEDEDEEGEEYQEYEESDDDDDALYSFIHPRARYTQTSQVDPAVVKQAGEGVESGVGEEEMVLGEEEGELDLEDMRERERERQEEIITRRRDKALAFLESIPLLLMTQMLTTLNLENQRLKVLLGTAAPADEEMEGGEKAGVGVGLLDRSTGRQKVLRFPGKGKQSAARGMASLMRVAELMHEAVLDGVVVTKRDIYYKDVELFKKQSVVDELVDTLAATAEMKRSDFNVCASAKGLIAADCLEVTLQNGKMLSLSPCSGTLIPPESKLAKIEQKEGKEVKWLLIVEKDAVFQTLCETGFAEDEVMGSGVIVTGKGFPDLSTIQMCRLLANQFPDLPLYALVDADPYGISILSTYTFGSTKSRHSEEMAGLALGERLQWLGVKVTDWTRMELGGMEGLLEMTERDRRLAQSMLLKRPDMPEAWRRELSHMLHIRKKAEIQILSSSSTPSTNTDSQRPSQPFGPTSDADAEKEQEGGERKQMVSKLVLYLREKMLG